MDWKNETLTIPAHRMKGPRDHVIPLSPPAMGEILRLAWSKPSTFPPPIDFPAQAGRRFHA